MEQRMKYLIKYSRVLFFIGLIALANVQANAESGYKIEIELSKTPTDTGYLAHFYGSKIVSVDTSIFDKQNKIVFEGAQTLRQGLYLLLAGQVKLEFIVSNQRFSIKSDFENQSNSVVIGSVENSIYFNYKSFLYKSLLSKYSLLKTSRNPEKDLNLKNQLKALTQKVAGYKSNLFKTYPNSFASKLIKANEFLRKKENLNKSKRELIFSTIDLNDNRMLYTPYLEEAIVRYLNLTPFNPDSLVKNCDHLLALSRLNIEVNNFVLHYLIQKFDSQNKPWFDVLYIHLNTKYVLKTLDTKSDTASIIASNIKRKQALLTGSIAPEINFFDTTGQRISLHSVKAKYTLVYFWDPDCDHCKIATPQLQSLYNKYNSTDFQVYAVSTQQQYKNWAKYIASNQLTWINVWEPELIESIYKRYQIGSTPQLFLLDSEKRILSKNISMDELMNYLNMLGVKK